jgi:hypothetical protein
MIGQDCGRGVGDDADSAVDFEDDEDEAYHIDDDDGGADSDADICERCECCRDLHEDGIGACGCGRCKKFKNS